MISIKIYIQVNIRFFFNRIHLYYRCFLLKKLWKIIRNSNFSLDNCPRIVIIKSMCDCTADPPEQGILELKSKMKKICQESCGVKLRSIEVGEQNSIDEDVRRFANEKLDNFDLNNCGMKINLFLVSLTNKWTNNKIIQNAGFRTDNPFLFTQNVFTLDKIVWMIFGLLTL